MTVIEITDPPMDEHGVNEKLDNVSDDIDLGESSLPSPPTLTPEEERRLYRKIDLRLIPILALIYLLDSMDKNEVHQY